MAKGLRISVALAIVCSLLLPAGLVALDPAGLTRCLSQAGVSNVTSRSSASSYSSLLYFSLQNLRFAETATPKPDIIIVPQNSSHVQSALLCSLKAGYQVRVRSGGHSFEGLSSTGTPPFVIIDLMNMHSVSVDVASKSAWVEAGATLGEIYYAIAQASSEYAFPAGACPTVGSGGHISGGGHGFLTRKYGLAADNVLDALLVDAQGRLLDRASMGEDVFFALRGGGGGTWGIVTAWRIHLVPVPPNVTSFQAWRTGKQALAQLIYRWQTIAPSAPLELDLTISIQGPSIVNVTIPNNDTGLGALFIGQYLGTVSKTLVLLNTIFPELNLTIGECKDGNWIDATANIWGLTSIEALTSRDYSAYRGYVKVKSDFVRDIIPKEGILGALDRIEANVGKGYMDLIPYGGVMEIIGTGAIAFPHRAGVLYNILYQVVWDGNPQGGNDAPSIEWIRELYDYMEPFVSHSPRAAYVNYIDLDLGTSSSVVGAATSWGKSYFLSNFPRLTHIKAQIDPSNIFSHPQSIPPL